MTIFLSAIPTFDSLVQLGSLPRVPTSPFLFPSLAKMRCSTRRITTKAIMRLTGLMTFTMAIVELTHPRAMRRYIAALIAMLEFPFRSSVVYTFPIMRRMVMIRRGTAAGRPQAHCRRRRRRRSFYLGPQPVSSWSLVSDFEGVVGNISRSEASARVQRKGRVQVSRRRAAHVRPTSHSAGAGLVGPATASAPRVDVSARVVDGVARVVVITWRGRRGSGRRRGIRAAA